MGLRGDPARVTFTFAVTSGHNSNPPLPDGCPIAYGPDPPSVSARFECFRRARFDPTHANPPLRTPDTQSGIATWNIECRRIGQLGGGGPGPPSTPLPWKHLTERFGPITLIPQRVVIAGHSAGAISPSGWPHKNALKIRSSISLAGAADIRKAWDLQLSSGVAAEFIGGPPEDFTAEYAAASPIELLPIEAPQILV